MVSQELLEMLRCPWDPARSARLVQTENQLVCERCGLRFQVRDGLPVMIVEEAELPPGCRGLTDLPCHAAGSPENQHVKGASGPV